MQVVVPPVVVKCVPEVGLFQVSVRSGSSARSVLTRRLVIGFMRGIRIPVGTVVILAELRISPVRAG